MGSNVTASGERFCACGVTWCVSSVPAPNRVCCSCVLVQHVNRCVDAPPKDTRAKTQKRQAQSQAGVSVVAGPCHAQRVQRGNLLMHTRGRLPCTSDATPRLKVVLGAAVVVPDLTAIPDLDQLPAATLQPRCPSPGPTRDHPRAQPRPAGRTCTRRKHHSATGSDSGRKLPGRGAVPMAR